MKKEAFLEELKKNLSVLEEKEIQDIIEEYEQHIDMKMERGLSEEAAIADFGDLKELSAGILEAYHVKADYQQEKKHLDFEKMKEEGRNATEKATNILGTGICAMGTGIRKVGSGIGKFIKLLKPSFREKRKKETGSIVKNEGKSTSETFKRYWQNIIRSIMKFFRACGICICNGFWAILGTAAFVTFLMMVFLLGLSTVLLVMGYPVIGIEIIIIGLGLVSTVVMLFSFSKLTKKKKQRTDAGGDYDCHCSNDKDDDTKQQENRFYESKFMEVLNNA